MTDRQNTLKAVATEARTAPNTCVLIAGGAGAAGARAAETIAADLSRTVSRIDLAALISKYIGETEKNLDALLRGAEQANAVLFVDEADALFGKRTGVKESHDRYANLDVSALLTRIERYHGVVVLATNTETNIDPAFTRRIRYAIDV
jgi:SpoVK/Ycf46/Vps4 family AAA+-type ATPase